MPYCWPWSIFHPELSSANLPNPFNLMLSLSSLRQQLLGLDGRGFKAYKELAGAYDYGPWAVFIDHVQGDPFAAPSKIRIRVPHEFSRFPPDLWSNKVREVAFRDFLSRSVHRAIRTNVAGRRGMGKSGLIRIDVGGQEVLERTAVVVGESWVEARLEIGLPANGRTILGRQAQEMLCEELPRLVSQGLRWEQLAQAECRRLINQVENFMSIQSQLSDRGLVAFVADGAVLPRASGISDVPLVGKEVRPLRSPASLSVMFEVPHAIDGERGVRTQVSGLGIPKGVTLIVGGGYHGKSTLLQALQRGVYPHIPGDGRELVVTVPDAVKIRAEDGRRVERVDISGFIDRLPQGMPTSEFSTDNASGSTSQAAGIMEALEIGTCLLLLDEDTSATNFMVRDARMQALVQKDHEPITPYLDRIRDLYASFGVSSILVMGGCGDYFDVADTVLMMKDYGVQDVTQAAKNVATTYPVGRVLESSGPLAPPIHRTPHPGSLNAAKGKQRTNITAYSLFELGFGSQSIDLKGVEQLVDESQTRAIGYALHYATGSLLDGKRTVKELVEKVLERIDEESLDVLSPFRRKGEHPGNFARPRKCEIAAALNRLRTVGMNQKT